jgi:hypothetical protein
MPRPKKQVDPMDTVVKLTVEELMRKRALEAEIKSARAQMTMVNMQVNAVIATNPELQRLLAEKEDQTKEISKRMGELNDLHAKIEAKYEVKLAECSFDDETGVIQILKKEEPPKLEETPAPRAKRGRRS